MGVTETPAALSEKLGAIDTAAAKLSAASYPFIKSAPWDSDVYIKPLPGMSPNKVMKAIDKALVMGASMDGKLLKEAAMAHHNANGSRLPGCERGARQGDRVCAEQPGHGRLQRFQQNHRPQVPSNLFNMVSPSEATAAYDAFLKFKDVVKA